MQSTTKLNVEGRNVRLTKIMAVAGAKYRTPEKDEYKPGEYNGPVSLPVDYVMVGMMRKDVEVGKGMLMFRTSRNNVIAAGLVSTSVVTEISECFGDDGKVDPLRAAVKTGNSLYMLEIL